MAINATTMTSNIDYNKLHEEILFDEGLRYKVYDDATGETLRPGYTMKGHATIGIGRNLEDPGLSDDEIKMLFLNDIKRVETNVRQRYGTAWFNQLSPIRKNVILGMVFNMGITRFSKFKKLIAALERMDYKDAAAEILDSKAARDLPSRYERYARKMRDNY